MGFFTNYNKANTEKLASNLLQDVTYNSQDSGALSIQALFNVREEKGENYVEQVGQVGVFIDDVTPATGDTVVDSDSRTWFIEGFMQQKSDMIFMRCYANNEARYAE